jgi:MFS family permease
MPVADAAGMYGFLAILNGLGRLFWGALSDRIGRRWTFAILFGGQALAFFALDADHEPLVVAGAIAALLFCYGGGFGTMPAYNADFFGTKHFGANYGAQISAWGLAAVFGTYFISTMRELSGSFAGLMQPISIVLLIAIFFPLITESPKRGAAAGEPRRSAVASEAGKAGGTAKSGRNEGAFSISAGAGRMPRACGLRFGAAPGRIAADRGRGAGVRRPRATARGRRRRHRDDDPQ